MGGVAAGPMSAVVLDTHAWLWWVDDPSRLGKAARETIEAAGSVGVSAISCWEVAMLAAAGLAVDPEGRPRRGRRRSADLRDGARPGGGAGHP